MLNKVLYCNICNEKLLIHESFENHGHGNLEKVIDIHCPNGHEWDYKFTPIDKDHTNSI